MPHGAVGLGLAAVTGSKPRRGAAAVAAHWQQPASDWAMERTVPHCGEPERAKVR